VPNADHHPGYLASPGAHDRPTGMGRDLPVAGHLPSFAVD
jgi:hypothetical protein